MRRLQIYGALDPPPVNLFQKTHIVLDFILEGPACAPNCLPCRTHKFFVVEGTLETCQILFGGTHPGLYVFLGRLKLLFDMQPLEVWFSHSSVKRGLTLGEDFLESFDGALLLVLGSGKLDMRMLDAVKNPYLAFAFCHAARKVTFSISFHLERKLSSSAVKVLGSLLESVGICERP